MKKVVIESPYAGNIKKNVKYARACMKDCLDRGEAPIASHLLYTQDGILDDTKASERSLGLTCGYIWGECADYVVIYIDNGISRGMEAAIEYWSKKNMHIEYRELNQ